MHINFSHPQITGTVKLHDHPLGRSEMAIDGLFTLVKIYTVLLFGTYTSGCYTEGDMLIQ